MSTLNIISLEEFHRLYPKDNIIATGGYGNVYTVKDKSMVVKEGKTLDLIKDIDILSQISHPNIIPITALTFDVSTSTSYIAFPRGESILSYLDSHRQMYDQFMYELVVAVAFLHSKGIAHCDIKPDNIIVIDQHPVLIDFGIAKICIPISDLHSRRVEYMLIPQAFTLSFNPPEYKQDISSIRGDVYSLGKTFECLYLKIRFYYPNDPLFIEGDDMLTNLFRDMLSDICTRPSAKHLMQHEFFTTRISNLDKHITGQCLTITTPEKGEFLGINSTIYYMLVDWILQALQCNTFITTRDMFLIFHNVHRSINVMKSYHKSKLQLFGMVNIMLAVTSTHGSETFSIKNLNTLTDHTYNEIQFMDMVREVLRQLDGIIYTPTYWDYCTSKHNLGIALKQTLHWNYPYIPYYEDAVMETCDKSTLKLVNAKQFIREWMTANKLIKCQWRLTMAHIISETVCKNSTVLTSVPATIPDMTTNELKIQLNAQSYDYGTNAAFGLIWALRSEMICDKSIANKILHVLVNCGDYGVKDVPGWVYMYDIIFGRYKLERLKGISLKSLQINTYTCNVQDILNETLQKLPVTVCTHQDILNETLQKLPVTVCTHQDESA
jgi:serine/threonine protein kinase